MRNAAAGALREVNQWCSPRGDAEATNDTGCVKRMKYSILAVEPASSASTIAVNQLGRNVS